MKSQKLNQVAVLHQVREVESGRVGAAKADMEGKRRFHPMADLLLILSIQQNEWADRYRRAGKERRGVKNFSACAEYRSVFSVSQLLTNYFVLHMSHQKVFCEEISKLILMKIVSNSFILYSID